MSVEGDPQHRPTAGETTRSEMYVGVFLISLATLMYEILLTRVFSVTMWHHFAFMAVSLAMFGTTVGAMCIFLAPRFFHERLAPFHMGVSSLLLATCIIGSILILMGVRFVPEIFWESLDAFTLSTSLTQFPRRSRGLPCTRHCDRHDRWDHDGFCHRLAGSDRFCLLPGP